MSLFSSGKWASGTAILEDDVLARKAAAAAEPLVERRQSARVSMSVPVSYRVMENGRPPGEGRTIDLSENGVRLAIPAVVTVGTWLELNIQLPGTPALVRMKGVVVWIVPSFSARLTLCGIAFKDFKRVPRKEKLIGFMADKFCQLALHSTSQLICRPAQSLEELKAAYRLIYGEYRVRGYCGENPSRMHYNHFCVLPDTRTFVLKKENQLFGTVSLILDSPCGLPMESLFPREIKRLRAAGRRLAEVGLLALDLEAIGRGLFSLTNFSKQACLFRLFKTMFDYARLVGGATDLIIGMHPKHATLYRYLTFETLGPVRSYPGACGKLALLMRMDVRRTEREVSTEHGKGAFFLKNPVTLELLERHYEWTPQAVRELLMEGQSLWQALSPTVQAYLRSGYPGVVAMGDH